MQHHLSLHAFKPQDESIGGYRITATKKSFPALQGMSFYKLLLQRKAVRDPHWHANADELGYCVKGSLLISLFGNHNERQSFIISEGECFFIPSGTLHGIENIGNQEAEVVLQFSHEEPEDFELSTTFAIFSDSVLGNTWDVESSVFKDLKRKEEISLITEVEKSTFISKEMYYTPPNKFALDASTPLLGNEGGNVKVARQNVWPILKKQALYSLHITGSGMREPHWHPETAEMGYVIKVKAKCLSCHHQER